jgi:hypothetical protein
MRWRRNKHALDKRPEPVQQPYVEQRTEWPPPREDLDREPSHPGAREAEDDDWWERWQEEHRGTDT